MGADPDTHFCKFMYPDHDKTETVDDQLASRADDQSFAYNS